jgi:hypothetical protein
MHFVLLGPLYNMQSHMVVILTLLSPHKLLKNLAHSPETQKAAKINNKKFKYLLCIPDTMVW